MSLPRSVGLVARLGQEQLQTLDLQRPNLRLALRGCQHQSLTKARWSLSGRNRLALGDAAEACVARHEGRLQPRQPAHLGDRPAGEDSVEMLEAAAKVELLIQRVVQLTQVDGALIMARIVILQCAYHFPMFVACLSG